jgi:protein involved in polysaccharide export with SLBB domain
MPIWGWLGWAAAAAASLLLIVNIWNSKPADTALNTATPTPISERLSPAQMRDRFMAAVPSTEMVKAEWGKGNVPNLVVSGDVVWSDKMQEGYLRFTNLPKNDTGVYTYQLWIFDENQDPKTPIDGGIFDVNADGEIIVPVTAKLRARGAKAFAITMEKPGGVMVSDRSKIVTLGAVKPNQA